MLNKVFDPFGMKGTLLETHMCILGSTGHLEDKKSNSLREKNVEKGPFVDKMSQMAVFLSFLPPKKGLTSLDPIITLFVPIGPIKGHTT